MPQIAITCGMIKTDCYNHFGAYQISATVPTMCEDYRGPYLCRLYPQTCLATGIGLAPIGPRMLEYGPLLYGNGKKKYDKKKTSRRWARASRDDFARQTSKKMNQMSTR